MYLKSKPSIGNKDLYFSRKHASEYYEFLYDKEYSSYSEQFVKFLEKLKEIRNKL